MFILTCRAPISPQPVNNLASLLSHQPIARKHSSCFTQAVEPSLRCDAALCVCFAQPTFMPMKKSDMPKGVMIAWSSSTCSPAIDGEEQSLSIQSSMHLLLMQSAATQAAEELLHLRC